MGTETVRGNERKLGRIGRKAMHTKSASAANDCSKSAGEAALSIKKLLRTAQSELPFLKEAKDKFYRHSRRLLRLPHERDFRAIAQFPAAWRGPYVDVGANHGQSIESILLFRPSAEIVSFEANPNLANALIQRYRAQPGIQIRPIGLASTAGEFTLYVPSYRGFVYDGLASLDRHSAETWINEKTVYWFNPAKVTIEQVACKTETLDSQKLRPSFIKIDVQGLEYEVVLGGIETIKACEPVLLLEDLHADERTVNLVNELGYEEYKFDGSRLRKGAHASTSQNSFLIMPARARELGV